MQRGCKLLTGLPITLPVFQALRLLGLHVRRSYGILGQTTATSVRVISYQVSEINYCKKKDLNYGLVIYNNRESGTIPRSWKLADIVPIFKKGMKSMPMNYRPVSLTSHIGKLMEKVTKEETASHLNHYDLRNCLTNLLTYLEGVTRMLDEGSNVDIIYLDFAKSLITG